MKVEGFLDKVGVVANILERVLWFLSHLENLTDDVMSDYVMDYYIIVKINELELELELICEKG